jgi:hypothetical protein
MDTSNHYSMATLFEQMGMDGSAEGMNKFLREHRLFEDQVIAQADFWSPSQAAFVMEAIAEDSDWSELVDQLDAALRH